MRSAAGSMRLIQHAECGQLRAEDIDDRWSNRAQRRTRDAAVETHQIERGLQPRDSVHWPDRSRHWHQPALQCARVIDTTGLDMLEQLHAKLRDDAGKREHCAVRTERGGSE